MYERIHKHFIDMEQEKRAEALDCVTSALNSARYVKKSLEQITGFITILFDDEGDACFYMAQQGLEILSEHF